MLSLQSLQQTLAALAPPAAAKKPAGRPKRAIVSLPEAGEDGAPSAEDYRLKEEEINADTCLGRRIYDNNGRDARWKPAVYREMQCGGKNVEGSNLCETCTRRLEKYVAAPTPKAGWTGLVTEEPLDWVHMLGTAWALEKQPKWIGVATSAAVSEAGSAPAATVEGELKLIDGTFYMVKGRDAYEYDSMTETVGVLVGELDEDGESITFDITALLEEMDKEEARVAAVAEAAAAEKAAAAAKVKAEKAATAAREKAVKAAAVAKARAEKAARAAAAAQEKADAAARDALALTAHAE